MTETPHSGTDGLSEDQRRAALGRFQILRPYLEEGVPLTRIAQEHHLGRTHADPVGRQLPPARTGRALPQAPATIGTNGRCPRPSSSSSKGSPCTGRTCRPRPCTARPRLIAARLGEPVPSYRTVHMVIRDLEPALVTLAHEGAKAYSDAFDLVHRTEAEGAQCHLAGRSHRARPLRDGRLGQAAEALADRHPRRSQPGDRRLSALLRGPVGDPDGAGTPPGDLAEGPAGLARLRHPPGPLHRPRQRLHLAAPGAGGRRAQDPADLLHRGEAARAGKDRAVLRIPLPGLPLEASRLWSPRVRPGGRADAAPTDPRGGALPDRRLPRHAPQRDRSARRRPAGRPAGSSRRCRNRSNNSTCSCSPCPSPGA